MRARIVCLPGDGIGPEVMNEAVRVLTSVACAFSHSFTFVEEKVGGASIDAYGAPLTQETLDVCKSADAILFGAVGGPKWDGLVGQKRPEQGLLLLRKELDLFANIRPCVLLPGMSDASPLKPGTVSGVDLLIVRELTGDAYFGAHHMDEEGREASDVMAYTQGEVERVARVAFRHAQKRRKSLCSVDKANVLAASRLWRETVTKVSHDYPEVALRHLYADNCAAQLVRDPGQFDVILAGNLFGDILSDVAAALTGSLGNLPSASLGTGKLGLYEPVHGSAPDIAGKDMANPIGMILSAAMLLRQALSLSNEAECVETAVKNVLDAGWRTADMAMPGAPRIGTGAIGKLIAEQVDMVGAVMGSLHR